MHRKIGFASVKTYPVNFVSVYENMSSGLCALDIDDTVKMHDEKVDSGRESDAGKGRVHHLRRRYDRPMEMEVINTTSANIYK
jgi:hypothetical protein